MSYHTKLLVCLLATAVISELVLGALFYFQFNRTLRDALASNVRSIALTTAALLKSDDHKLVILALVVAGFLSHEVSRPPISSAGSKCV